MAILSILEAPNPTLKLISKPVEVFDDALQTLITDMFETMYDAPGIGLAAIQVNVPKRVLVIDLQEKDAETEQVIRNPRVFINPEILEESEELSFYNEMIPLLTKVLIVFMITRLIDDIILQPNIFSKSV